MSKISVKFNVINEIVEYKRYSDHWDMPVTVLLSVSEIWMSLVLSTK